jgi:pimeloyl-ACP methyl ester carboxylesterase
MYIPFLNAIRSGAVSFPSSDPNATTLPSSESSRSSVTIFAHSHLGLSSYFNDDASESSSPIISFPETSCIALPAQIQAHVEFLDELLAVYDNDLPDATATPTRVLLVGHSIGAWFVQEVLKARPALRPRVGAYMLFPTISHIARSPHGRMLSVRALRLLFSCGTFYI